MRWLTVVALVACSAPTSPPVSHAQIAKRAPAVVAPPPAPFPPFTSLRLPHTFEPTRYRARIALGDGRFTGHIEIDGTLSDPVTLIWLHDVDLPITHAVARQGTRTIGLEASSPRDDQLVGLRTDHTLEPGAWTLELDYTGPIRPLERPVATPFGGQRDAWALGLFARVIGVRTYVFTQSESIYARRIFPCIDEPDRKVPWQLTLDVEADVVAASNTPIVRETAIDPKHKRVEFAETRPLPSYLIAFAVGPFDVVDGGTTRGGAPIRVLVEHGRAASGAWAATAGPKALARIEDYLAIPYPYPKLDLVAVAKTGWGAMENPGLITFDASILETDHELSVVEHELAHQWFGDLVTLGWWDEIWLSESFARWMTDKLDKPVVDPTEERAQSFVGSGLEVRHAIADNGDLAFDRFAPYDAISRGAKVLRGYEAYLGETRFRDALREYVHAHADGTVTTADLGAALSRTAGVPLTEGLVGSLSHATPVLVATLDCTNGAARVNVSTMEWSTHVCFAYDRDGKRADTCVDLDTHSTIVPLPSKHCPRWVMPNAGGLGLYQTRWPPDLLDPLLGLGWASLTTVERRTLFEEVHDDDVRELTIFTRLLDGPASLSARQIVSQLDQVAYAVPEDLRGRLVTWVSARLGATARGVAFDDDPSLGGLERGDRFRLVRLFARLHDPELTAKAIPLASRLLSGGFVRAVYALAATADPKLRESYVAEVGASSTRTTSAQAQRIEDLIDALEDVPGVIDDLERDPSLLKNIGRYDLKWMFRTTCDPQVRDRLVALGTSDKITAARAAIDACLAKQARLDPVFRAWLRPPKKAH